MKEEVISVFLSQNAVSNSDCSQWSGNEIALFQEDFIQKVKSGFSEKWFYTYFKNNSEKLPRIDMLNLMSQYAGFQNFHEFRRSIDNKISAKEINDKAEDSKKEGIVYGNEPNFKKRKFNNKVILLGFALVSFILWFSYSKFFQQENTFKFCFVEKSNGLPPKTPLRITILLENESPLELQTNENACFEYTTHQKEIKFVVQSTFHEPDTIVRKINSGNQEKISLISNDYALMLQYYTSSNSQNWKKRREHLNKLLAHDAKIYRLYPQQGISVYSKSEFIDQLTLPTKNLNNIEIIETQYKDNQIVKLKFKVTE